MLEARGEGETEFCQTLKKIGLLTATESVYPSFVKSHGGRWTTGQENDEL